MSEKLLSEREAVEKMRDALLLADVSRREVMSIAAHGIEWRNERIEELEEQVIRLGGWPWERGGGEG